MGYFSQATLNAVLANPQGTVPGLYASTKPTFVGNLPAVFSTQPDAHLALAFAAVLAFDLKPYGPATTSNLAAILASPTLNCDEYAVLAVEFFRMVKPGSTSKPALVGWNGGAVGNHAQVVCETPGQPPILCDPTIGVLAHGLSLDLLCKGFRAPAGHVASFFGFASRANIATFEPLVRNALLQGQYRASDLLYYAPDLEKFRALGPVAQWATPQSWNIP